MAQSPAILVDDQDPQIQYLCDTIHEPGARSYYNKTWTTFNGNDCTNGWFNYTFSGVGIRIAASIAPPAWGASYSVKLDDGQFVIQSGSGDYVSPPLSDGEHTITYAVQAGRSQSYFPAFDYLAVSPGSTTPLEGRTLAVDDADRSISYSGKWSNSPPIPLSSTSTTSLYANTTHWTSTVGDSLQFKFEGSSISVFGIVLNSTLSNITAIYTLDGASQAQGLPQGTLDSLPMANLYHADVQPGVHTLVVNVTEIRAPQALGIDFIAYNATSSSVLSISGASSTSDPLGAGSKIGIAIGVVAFVALLGSLFWVFRKRYRRNINPKFRLPDNIESGVKKPAPW